MLPGLRDHPQVEPQLIVALLPPQNPWNRNLASVESEAAYWGMDSTVAAGREPKGPPLLLPPMYLGPFVGCSGPSPLRRWEEALNHP